MADETNEEFEYDAASNLTSYTNRNGDEISYEFDALNRLTLKKRPNDPNINLFYDIAGRSLEIRDGIELTELFYDRLGRVKQIIDPDEFTVSYEYDELGRPTKLTYPDDSYITYKYDELSRLTDILDSDSNVLAHYGFDELSRRTAVELINDANCVYEYDLGNRLTSMTNNLADPNSTSINYDFTHDKVGNRVTITKDGAESRYIYDQLYQLTGDPCDNNTTYNYDALGNRVSVVTDSGTTGYSSNSVNQYTSVGEANFTYDDNGNLTAYGANSYTFDCENRLTYAITPDCNVAYGYDVFGKRVSQTIIEDETVTTTKYAYDGWQVIAEYDGSDNLLRKFVYGPGIDEPIAMIAVDDQTETWYYYHYDGLGSVVALTDSNGDIVESYSYNVFGKVRIFDENGGEISQSAVGNPYMFTARRLDEATGLYYYRLRYYSANIGRFLQTDPLLYYDGLNLYEYCKNNPATFRDPWGLCSIAPKSPMNSTLPPWFQKFPHTIPNINPAAMSTTRGPYPSSVDQPQISGGPSRYPTVEQQMGTEDPGLSGEDIKNAAEAVGKGIKAVGRGIKEVAKTGAHLAGHLAIEYFGGFKFSIPVILLDDLAMTMGDGEIPWQSEDPNAPFYKPIKKQ